MKKLSVLILFGILLLPMMPACSQEGEPESERPQLDLPLEEVVLGSNEEQSVIFALKGTNGADDGAERLLALMKTQGLNFYKTTDSPQGLIARNDVVLLKFNCQWAERGGTNTDLVKSVVNAILAHPEGFQGEVVIADNGQGQYGSLGMGGSIDWQSNNALDHSQSVRKVAEGFKDYKVSALTWDSITNIQVAEYFRGDYDDGFIVYPEMASTGYYVSYPKFKTEFGTYVSFKEGIWDDERQDYDTDRLKVINMPVLKSHQTYQVTACIKNYMGTVSDKLTDHTSHQSVISGGMGTQMASTRMPVLNILDAIWINPYPRRGPRTPYNMSAQTNIIAASTDPAALDYWAAKNIMMVCAQELTPSGYKAMDPDGEEPGEFGYWLKKSQEQLAKAGYKATVEPEEINVYVEELD